jgi:hypothetical protein
VAALDGLAHHRRDDLVGNLNVPDLGLALLGSVCEQRREGRRVTPLVAARADAVRDVLERRLAEDRQAAGEAVGAQRAA